jgi:hypothetical protein
MDDGGVDCRDRAVAVTGDPDGFVYADSLKALRDAGSLTQTEYPPGYTGVPLSDPDLDGPLIVNCPIPVSVVFGSDPGGSTGAGLLGYVP